MHKDQWFFWACVGYIGGVLVGSFFVNMWWVVLLLCALWIAFLLSFPGKQWVFFGIPLGLFLLGIILVTEKMERFQQDILYGGEVSGIARVVNDPEEKLFYRQSIVRMEACESVYCPREKIVWQTPLAQDAVFGARIAFRCTLTIPENFNEAFDYRMFLAKNNIGYICQKAPRADTLSEDKQARLMRFFLLPKRAFENALKRSISQPEAGLATGLLLGGDSHLPDTLKQAFVKAGLSHIIAISGYNIALIAQGCILVGLWLGLWRKQALFFAAIGIVLFVILVGVPASAVRAGVMALSAFAALFFGRLSQSVNMLFCAGAVMLVFQPLLLRYDVGFQLSFLATLAIIIALPIMARIFPKPFFGKGFVEIAFLTFVVELFVVPLIAYQFQTFAPFALLANVLVLPLVPYAMALTFIARVAFFVLPGLHIIPAALAYGVLRLITFIAEHVSLFSSATLTISFGVWALCLWYAGLFFVIVVWRWLFQRSYVKTKTLL